MTHILVTNDDGINAPGLIALVQALRSLGKVTVCVPDRNWSAGGHVKTLHKPLRAWDSRLADGTAVIVSNGAPSDCVALAMLGLVPEAIDLVVSGINAGANLGYDLTYSGTVTAAMEAVISGAPAISISLCVPEPEQDCDYTAAARFALHASRNMLTRKIPKGILLNINVPCLPEEKILGVRITRQGLRVYRDELVARKDPRGKPYYWIGGGPPTGIPEEDSDFWAVSEGFISVTPVQLDLTAYSAIEGLQAWDWSGG
ncbi:MAG: 5'/3'-nucleotidase SurE [Anaerolineales bacterium]